MDALKCSVCGGYRVSPPLTVLATNFQLMYEPEPHGGFFAKVERYGPPVARACVDCGHVMWFVAPDDLAKLRSDLSRPPKK